MLVNTRIGIRNHKNVYIGDSSFGITIFFGEVNNA